MNRSVPWSTVRRSLLAIALVWVVAACSAPLSPEPEPDPDPDPNPPIAVDDAYLSPHDALLQVPEPGLLANDTPNGGVADEGVRSTSGGGTATVAADGSFSYQPTAGFSGTDVFTYTVTNADGTSPAASVQIEVPEALFVDLPPLPVAAGRLAAAAAGGVVYAFGGEVMGGRNASVYAYDRTVGAWTEGPEPMPVPVSNVCTATIGEDVYAVGGSDATAIRTDGLQVYDTLTETWSVDTTDPLPEGRIASACAVHDGALYVFGGLLATAAETPSSLRYDPTAADGERWTSIAPLPAATAFGAAATIDDRIYVLRGGMGDSTAVDVYDPAADAWAPYPDLLEGRGGAALWTSGPYLYAGGGGWTTYLTSVERYDTRLGDAGTWVADASMNTGRRTFGFTTDESGRFYAVGGWAGAFLDAAEEGLLRAPLP